MNIDEKLERTIGRVTSWLELNQLQQNINDRGGLTDEIDAALTSRSAKLGIAYFLGETGLASASLTAAEEKIISAIGEYAAILRREGKYPTRTKAQVRRLHGKLLCERCGMDPVFVSEAKWGRHVSRYISIQFRSVGCNPITSRR